MIHLNIVFMVYLLFYNYHSVIEVNLKILGEIDPNQITSIWIANDIQNIFVLIDAMA